MYNLLCHSILHRYPVPLSSRWQLWVRGREGPPLPQSALPGPRAYEYQRYSSYNRQWSATFLPPTMARGPPRSNVRGMRLSSLASPFIWMRASCHLRTSCRVGIGCDSLSSAALQIKSQEPSLRGNVYYPPTSPKGGQNLLARSSPEVCCTPLTLRSAHIFRGLAGQRDCSFRALRSFLTTALQSQTRPEVSLSGCLCQAYTLRECSLTSFRVTWFPPSLPSPSVSSSLSAPTPHPSASSKNTPPPARLSRPKRCCRVPLFHHSASGGVTFLPRPNLIPSAACRGLRPCLLTSYETLSASLPETRKMSSPTTLTHAPSACRISPASHARREVLGYKNLSGSEAASPPLSILEVTLHILLYNT
jgi:hypothetical protein